MKEMDKKRGIVRLAVRLRLNHQENVERRESMETVQTVHAAYTLEGGGMAHEDDNRFRGVLSRYSPALYRIAFRKLGNAEDAEDALQDALLSAFKHMHQFRGDAQLSTWLGSIVLNAARMHLRRRINHNFVSLDDGEENLEGGRPMWAERLEDSSPDAEAILRQKQARENLERVLEMLPLRLRVAFRLVVFEGLTIAEAANSLGIPEGTLKARVFRARRQVMTIMRRALQSPRTNRTAAVKR